jgi:hypothetical protein
MDNHSGLPEFLSRFVRDLVDKEPDWPSRELQWAQQELCALRKRGAEREIEALLQAGCEELPLAMAINIARVLDQAPYFCSKILGSQKFLERATEELELTACLFDALPPELSSELSFRETVVSPLRHYKLFCDEVRALLKQMMIRKVRERYMLCAYVKSATGRAHDREVSAIISIVTGEDLDENTLRIWRHDSKKIDGRGFEVILCLAQLLGSEHKKSE